MEIIPDPVHVALLALPFFTTVVGMYLILWRPLLDWVEERETVSQSAYAEAEELEQAARDHVARIEAQLEDAHKHAGVLRQEARDRALVKEAEIVAAARVRADEQIQAALVTIRTEQESARSALAATARELSTTIAARVLGRDVA